MMLKMRKMMLMMMMKEMKTNRTSTMKKTVMKNLSILKMTLVMTTLVFYLKQKMLLSVSMTR